MVIGLLIGLSTFAQSPSKFNYQAVARDGAGDLVTGQAVSVKISILSGSASGTSVYSEDHSPTTNAYGLFNFQIGNGTGASGDISTIDWGSTSHFIKVEMDPAGGTNYAVTSTSELVSVPYAEHANSVANDAVDDADADPANELQFLSQSGDTIAISDGNYIVLTAPEPVLLDNDSTNELQSMSLTGNTLSLSNGGGDVDLSDYDQSADVATNATDISTNATDIATNATDIGDNTTDIATNATDIATNATDIGDNTTDIATNATDIATNASDIGDNATDIATNATDIATNASDIGDNATDIATNATDIATNASDIGDNATDIATNASDIGDNATDIATNASDIAAHNAADLDTDSTNELITSTAFANDSTLMIYEGVDSFAVDLSSLIDDDDWVRSGDTLYNTSDAYIGVGASDVNNAFKMTIKPTTNLGGLNIERDDLAGNNYGIRIYDYSSLGSSYGMYIDMYQPSSTSQGIYNRIYDPAGQAFGVNNYIYSPGSTSYGTYNYIYDGTSGYGVYNRLYSMSSTAYGTRNAVEYSAGTSYGTENYMYQNSGTSYGMRNYIYTTGTASNYGVDNYVSGRGSYQYGTRNSAYNYYTSSNGYAYGSYNTSVRSGGTYGYALGSYNQGTRQSGNYGYAYGSSNRANNYSYAGYAYGAYNYAYTNQQYGRSYGSYNYAYGGGSNDYVYGSYHYGSGGNSVNYALYSAGYAYISSGYWGSDRKLKKNIRDYEGAIDDIMSLQPREYDCRVDEFPTLGLPTEPQLGLIAQELEEVFPELIKETHNPKQVVPESAAREQGLDYKVIMEAVYDDEGTLQAEATVEVGEEFDFKAVNYIGLVPVLIKGIQEQQAMIEALEARIEELESE